MKYLTQISIMIFCALTIILPISTEARGRTGSHRVGGYNSHGKGSHYVGRHVSSGHHGKSRKHR